MSAIGERNTDLFLGAKVTFYRPATDDTTVVYWSNRSWITNPDDSVDANRQFIGLLLQGFTFDYSLFSGDALGGRSTRNNGELRAFNPDGDYSLDYIFDGAYSVQGQPITYWVGKVGEDLADMDSFTLQGRHVRQSEDGTEVVIDLADAGQALDTSVFIDRFQGLDWAIRHDAGEASTIGASASLDPSTAFYFEVAYRLAPWATLGSGLQLASRAASGGGHVYRLEFASDGDVNIISRTSADATVTLDATDLSWVADGRWHRVGGRWTGTVLEAYHSTRTGGAKSTVTAAQTTIKAGTGTTSFGDVGATLGTHDWVDIGEVRLALDANVPTEAEIIARMKRPLTEDEEADYRYYVKCNENTGTTSQDETANNHDLTLHASAAWVNTFEGTDDLAGQAKPLAFGRIFNAPITWADREEGIALVHARGYKGIEAIYEGANRLVMGWPKTQFQSVRFTAATDTISFDTITSPAGVSRLHAQPGMQGLVDGQKIVIVGTASNNGTYTVNGASTERTIAVDEALTDESPVDCYITALNASSATPDVEVYFDAGAVKFTQVPQFPVTAEVLGDYGNETPTDSGAIWFPEYTAAIMRTLLKDWGGVAAVDIATNWDIDPVTEIGAIWAYAGVWLDPARDRAIRDVMDQGASTLWAAWGQDVSSGDWDLYVIQGPSGTEDIALTALEILGLRRIRSVEPVGGLILRSTVNYRPLDEGEVAGIADAATAAALRREHLEAKANIDPDVAAAFPLAETPSAIDTWLREIADARVEAQRRYDILKTQREMYHVDVILYGLDQNLLHTRVNLTDGDFPTLESGKDFWLVHVQARDEEVTWTTWG